MEALKKYYKKITEKRNDKIYASPLKRFGSFVIDSIIILIIFNGSVKILEHYNFDSKVYKEEIVTENFGTENEHINMQETLDKKAFARVYYIMLTISTLYFVGFLSSKKQATIGNQIFKIMVIHTKKVKVGPLTAFIRYISLLLNNSLYGVGYLFYFFTKDRAIFQDIASDTRVINLEKK